MAMSPQEEYFELYKTALPAVRHDSYSGEQWGEAAATMAIKLMQRARLPTAATPAPNMPEVLPEGTVAGHRFGAAFQGWDENCLVHCLVAIQQIVIAKQYGATAEQLVEPQSDLDKAIARLLEVRIAAAAAAAAAKAKSNQ